MDQFPFVYAIAACMYWHILFHVMTSHSYYAKTLCAAYVKSSYSAGDVEQ